MLPTDFSVRAWMVKHKNSAGTDTYERGYDFRTILVCFDLVYYFFSSQMNSDIVYNNGSDMCEWILNVIKIVLP